MRQAKSRRWQQQNGDEASDGAQLASPFIVSNPLRQATRETQEIQLVELSTSRAVFIPDTSASSTVEPGANPSITPHLDSYTGLPDPVDPPNRAAVVASALYVDPGGSIDGLSFAARHVAARGPSSRAVDTRPRDRATRRRVRDVPQPLPESVPAAARVFSDASSLAEDISSACDAVAQLTPEEARAAAPHLVPALAGRLSSSLGRMLGQSALGKDDDGVSSLGAAEAAASFSRAMARMSDHCGSNPAIAAAVLTSGTPAALSAALASYSPHSSATVASSGSTPRLDIATLSHLCWLVGNVSAEPRCATAFLDAGGAIAIMRLLRLMRDSDGRDATSASSDVVLQALVALVSLADQPRGAEAVASAGAVAAVVPVLADATTPRGAHGGVVVAACRLIERLLMSHSGPSAPPEQATAERATQLAAARDLCSCGGLAVLVALLASPRAAEDADVALHAASTLLSALSLQSEVSAAARGGGAAAGEAVSAAAVHAAQSAGAVAVLAQLIHQWPQPDSAEPGTMTAAVPGGSPPGELQAVLRRTAACLADLDCHRDG